MKQNKKTQVNVWNMISPESSMSCSYDIFDILIAIIRTCALILACKVIASQHQIPMMLCHWRQKMFILHLHLQFQSSAHGEGLPY